MKDACQHGVEGGCDVSCEDCGHTCRRHLEGLSDGCTAILPIDDEPCGCDEFKEPPA